MVADLEIGRPARQRHHRVRSRLLGARRLMLATAGSRRHSRRRQSHPRLGTVHRHVAERRQQRQLRRRLHQHHGQLSSCRPQRFTVAAFNGTMTFGGPCPHSAPATAASSTATGLVAGPASPPARRRDQLEHVCRSPYGFLVSGTVDSNYTIQLVPGSVTVGRAALT